MSRINLLPKFTVKVEGGSGCLFQPINDEYSYILTAKHVISGNNAPSIIRQNFDENGNVINETFEIIGEPFRHSDNNKDAAIIKVKKIDTIEALLRDDLLSENKDGYYLCGHPDSRRNQNESFRLDEITILQPKEHNYRESKSKQPIIYNEVIGQSGGGILKVEDSCILLAGIQSRMAAEDGKETLGRLVFMPVSFFDEIIAENEDELCKLFPPYIGSFERLLNDIFPLPNLEYKKDLIQNELKKISKDLCSDFAPNSILEIFKDEFLANGTEKTISMHKRLWSSFLELLTYNQLHSERKLKLEDLKELHKKRKLFIIDTNSWTKKINEIYSSDLSDIEIGGSIVVCATNENNPSRVEYSKEELKLLIPDITSPIDPKNISNTVSNPFEELKLVNIFKFQDSIIKNILKYQEMTVLNSRETIKVNTDGIL
ncbi:MAG: ABC-three component system protein [Bacteroidia bacterium]